MPTYVLENEKTGEIIETLISISEMERMKKEGWKTVPHSPRIVSESGDMFSKIPDSYNDHLKQIKKGSGRSNTIKTK